MTYLWSVFTKPWSGLPGDELGRLVAGLGFSGAEIPVRDNAYVTPDTVEAELPTFTEHFKLVWDAAHDALAGDHPAVTLELGADRLGIVNLKNVKYVETDAGWKPSFVQGDEGLSDWSAVFAALATLKYDGPICLTGQY